MSIERWDIDSSRSRIAFAVRHLVFSKTRGHFSRWSGTVTIPDGDCNRATVDVVIAASSIDTGVARRDEHLRSADYLDVTRFPEITFTAQTVQAMPEGHFRVVGALTLRGVTREVALDVAPLGPAADPRSSHRARLAATATLDRRDFEFTGNPALDSGGLVIGERIVVEVEVEAVRKPAARVA